jgi:alpha-ketoglutarate-dependent 2,4-dichlorophenoxyacetate dioxygenase
MTTMLDIKPLHPLFAAEVRGVDPAKGASAEEFAAIDAAFARYSVLVFPDQDIDDAQQMAFSAHFGPLEVSRSVSVGAGTHLVIQTNMGPDGEIVAPTARQMLHGQANRFWHTDSSFKATPSCASALSARIIPSAGGNTEFATMRAAYAALPQRLKDAVAGKVAVHDFAYGRGKVDPNLVTAEERETLPPVRHVMVLDHGPLGKSLYIGAHVARVEGMDEAEGRALVDELMEFATQDRFVYSHAWRPHDLVLWDNLAVLHRATPFASTTERGRMVRTTMAAPGPTVAAA